MTLSLKTLNSIKTSSLIPMMLGSAAVAGGIVTLFVLGGISISGMLLQFEWEWLNVTLQVIFGTLLSLGGWFMLPSLIVIAGGLFQERVILKVERTEYPQHSAPSSSKFWPDFKHDLRFTFKAIGLNLLVLPSYAFGIGWFVAIMLNTYLLGRELFESTAGFHIGKPQAKALIKRHRSTVYFGGFLITLTTLIPIIQCFTPILGTVWMTHAYHQTIQSKSDN